MDCEHNVIKRLFRRHDEWTGWPNIWQETPHRVDSGERSPAPRLTAPARVLGHYSQWWEPNNAGRQERGEGKEPREPGQQEAQCCFWESVCACLGLSHLSLLPLCSHSLSRLTLLTFPSAAGIVYNPINAFILFLIVNIHMKHRMHHLNHFEVYSSLVIYSHCCATDLQNCYHLVTWELRTC